MRGSKRWLDDGAAPCVEPPGWRTALPFDKDGVLELTPDRSVEIALLESREYQSALEGVYLNALSLTLNRFEFQVQWFANDTFRLTQFGSSETENNTLANDAGVGFTRAFAAGGRFLAEFANNLVLNFSNGATTVRSDLVFQLAQPLLRNAGRQVRLESLTQAERDLPYAVRDFARFRKIFYADLTTRGNGYLGLLLQTQNVRNFGSQHPEPGAEPAAARGPVRRRHRVARAGRSGFPELPAIAFALLQPGQQGVPDGRVGGRPARVGRPEARDDRRSQRDRRQTRRRVDVPVRWSGRSIAAAGPHGVRMPRRSRSGRTTSSSR